MKYYGVKKGRRPGVYTSWADCSDQINKYSGAVYKKFDTQKEANKFVYGKKKVSHEDPQIQKIHDPHLKHLVAYVDGSFLHHEYAFGCVLIKNGDIIDELFGKDDDAELVSMRNVAGELLGAETAVRYAIANAYQSIEIHFDYEGIEKWATDQWKANKIGTQRYQKFMHEASNKILINFVKVKAHTGVAHNERADALAKKALGI